MWAKISTLNGNTKLFKKKSQTAGKLIRIWRRATPDMRQKKRLVQDATNLKGRFRNIEIT